MPRRLPLLGLAVLLIAGCSGSGNERPTAPTPVSPLFLRSGTGNDVFTKPATVTTVRITGTYTANSSNFIIWCDSQLVVNELLGTGWGRTQYNGTHATPSCTQVRVENSTGVAWTFNEVR